MIIHKGAAALDGHPKQQRETEPSSKRLDPKAIIKLVPEIEQLPLHPSLIVDPVLLDQSIQIYGGIVNGKIVLSSQPDLYIDPLIYELCETLKSSKHYDVVIRRAISAMMRGDYQSELVFSAKRELHKLDIKASESIFRQDNCRSERGQLPGPNKYRIARAFAAVLWERIINRCAMEYKPMLTDTIIVTT